MESILFKENKYTSIYYRIIESAKQHPPTEYKECHHIIPRALGGNNDQSNLIDLTPKQHYICHALLPKMVSSPKHIRAMYAAFNMMHVDSKGRRYTSNLYQYYKVKFYKAHSEQMKGKVRSIESRQKQSTSSKGKPWSKAKKESAWVGPTAVSVKVFNKKTRKFLGYYESISSAAKALNADPTQIWKILKGTLCKGGKNGMYPSRSAKGCCFMFKTDNQDEWLDRTYW